MHQNKSKSIADCLRARTEYAVNPAKTQGGELVSAYECHPETVSAEFLLTKRVYEGVTGRAQQSNVIAYQIRQSFKPGEVTAEVANAIGYELGMSFTKGKHAFIVATHTDKLHVHNHIIFNSTTLDCTNKFRDFKRSGKAIMQISDRICLEHGLSIVETPQHTGTHYGKWLGDKKPLSNADKLRQTIHVALAEKPKDFAEFLRLMQSAGYEIESGVHHAFKGAEQKKFIRLRSLGEGYSEDDIRAVIRGEAPRKMAQTTLSKRPQCTEKSVNLLIDIQAKLDEGKGKGYEQWAKIFNLKQMAKTINFLRENELMEYGSLEQKATELTTTFNELSAKIKTAEKRMAELAVLKKHIYNYSKTRDIYTAYRKSGHSKKYFEAHRAELTLHKAAKSAFDELGVQKIPKIKTLDSEYSELLSSKKEAYSQYHAVKKQTQAIGIAKMNIDCLLGAQKECERTTKTQEQR